MLDVEDKADVTGYYLEKLNLRKKNKTVTENNASLTMN